MQVSCPASPRSWFAGISCFHSQAPVLSGGDQMIHPTAIIHPGARLDPTVRVGPYAVIDEHVVIGASCRIGPHAHLTGQTRIGANNIFHAGCVIGDAPQDLKYQGAPTRLRIGDNNVFREHVTVHRSNKESQETVIGSYNYLMAHCHVGHNTRVADQVIIANGALLGGHVVVQDRAFLSGNRRRRIRGHGVAGPDERHRGQSRCQPAIRSA